MIAGHEVLKALHIFSVVVWIGGMMATALLIPRLPGGKAMADARRVLSPMMSIALIATLAIGLIIAMQTGWISERWVHAKLAIAFVLAGLHGVLSGHLRRLSADGAPSPGPLLGYVPALVGMLSLAAIVLAAWKP